MRKQWIWLKYECVRWQEWIGNHIRGGLKVNCDLKSGVVGNNGMDTSEDVMKSALGMLVEEQEVSYIAGNLLIFFFFYL